MPPIAAALSRICWFTLLLLGQRNQAGFASFLEPVALSADVDGGGVVQQSVEDGCCDDRVAEDRSPLAVALVRSEYDGASFIACADKLEEDSCAEIVQRQVSHFVNDQNLGNDVDAYMIFPRKSGRVKLPFVPCQPG